MNYDDILKKLNKIMAERFMKDQDTLFGQAHRRQQATYDAFKAQQAAGRQAHDDRSQAFGFGFSGFKGPKDESKMDFPDDGKTITLDKGDCRVMEDEDEQTSPPLLRGK